MSIREIVLVIACKRVSRVAIAISWGRWNIYQ